MKQLLPAILILVSSSFLLNAQEHAPERINLQQLSDDIFGLQDHDVSYEELYENLAVILADPLDLNTVSEDQLRMLGVLSEIQIREFLNYRTEQEKFFSVYELQVIPTIDLQTVYKILPYVKTTDPATSINEDLLRRMYNGNNTYLILRQERNLEQKKGFSETLPAEERFHGSADRMLMRFRSSHAGDFSLGFTMEKDAGESIAWKPGRHQFGFDYNSFHLHLQNKKRWKSIIAGDFQVQAGQGLVISPAFGLGKGSETINTTMKSNAGLLPHTSSAESGYLRGIGATYLLKPFWRLTGFFSRAQRDARLVNDTTGLAMASSLLMTGMHRNEKELAAKNNLTEQTSGAVLNYRTTRTDAGIILVNTSFDHTLEREQSAYNRFTHPESNYTNASFFVNHSVKNILFFSEAAKAISGGTAVLAGLVGSLSPTFDMSLVYRNYSRDYHAIFSNSFAESSVTQNEYGFYWGVKYKWNRKYQVSGYTDIFYFPWIRYRSYALTGGHEILLRFSYQPSRKSSVVVQAREENKTRNTDNSHVYNTDSYKKVNYLIHAQYNVSRELRFRTRVQLSSFNFSGKQTKGTTISQDIQWSTGKLTLTARHAIFDTDDHDNRHYAYEDDVWLAFSIPSHSGTGTRNYIMVEYKISRHVCFWLRYARTRFTEKRNTGAGLDAISGEERNDIKFQVMLRI